MLKLFSRLRRKSSPMDVLREFLSGAGAASGVRVTWKTAIEAVTAMACARVIAEGIAQVPLKLFRTLDNGGAEPAIDHPLYDMVSHAPNGWQSSYDWRESMGLHLVLAGNAYAIFNRNQTSRGASPELLPFEPGLVRTSREAGYGLVYNVQMTQGETLPVSQERMLHVHGASWDTWSGLDGVKLAREAIGLSVAQEQHGAKLFKNGATLGGILTTEGSLKPEDVTALQEAWESRHAGGENAYKTAIMWGGLKWQSTGSDNEKTQFNESRSFQVEEVCRAFRVLPVMVGHSDKAATYASAEQMFLAHVVHTMGPWYAKIEQALNLQLLTREERRGGLYFKFIPAAMLRGAHKDRAEYYRVMREIGALNANEIRALEEMNPYAGGEDYLMPLNMAVAGQTPAAAEDDNA